MTSDDTVCTLTERSASSLDDWESADLSRCLLLFVSLAVMCDLLGWWEHWGWGLVYFLFFLKESDKALIRANGKSANQWQLAMNATLTEPKRPANNGSLTVAENLS